MISSVVRTLVIYVVVIFAMRLMGKRQLGELQPSELVTTFLISNVASICIDEPDLPLASSLVPIFLIAALEILSSTAAFYLPTYARLLFGKPITVLRDGQIDQQALSHLRITASDLAEALRGKDVYNPEDVAWGVIEPNGSLNLAPKPAQGEPAPMLPLLIDRHLYAENLAAFGLDKAWLNQQLSAHKLCDGDVLIFLYNGENSVLIPKQKAAAQAGRQPDDMN